MLMLHDPTPSLSIILRPYQAECVERVICAFQKQPQGGKALIVLPTGGGKTIVFAEIARRLGLPTLMIAHRQELLQQAAEKFRLVDGAAIIGQVGAGRHEWGAPITVASIQTISRPEHLKQLNRFGYGLVVIDECHHSATSGYQAVLDALPDAFVLGVTATPDRLDEQPIEAIFGQPVFSASIIDLVEARYLCDLRAIAIPTTTSLDAVHTQAGDFKADELEVAIDTPERNRRIAHAYLKHAQGRQALCFSVTVAHAWHLADMFIFLGVPASVVSGETPAEERRRILHDYERGEIKVVCNCGVLTEGYDAPQTSCIIMARPTKSRALFVQCVGRGTRLAPGKRDCVILDITDNCLKHRLQPLTLNTVLGKLLLDGESVTEARARHRQEAEDQEREARTTKVTKRVHDLTVNLLARMDWKRLSGGRYLLEIGEHKHQIFLLPSEITDGYYAVWAKLAPDYTDQQWMKDVPLDWAQTHAEMKARLLQADEKNLVLVNGHAAWRARPVSEKQKYLLQKFALPFSAGMTAGEASDLIGKAIAEQQECHARQQAARKGAAKHRKVRTSS